MENELAVKKYKQYICENSHELREFERKIQTAYNLKVLQAKIAIEHAEKLKEKIHLKQMHDADRKLYQLEQERLQDEEECKKRKEKEVAVTLKAQIERKKKEESIEIEKCNKERILILKRLEEEKAEEEREFQRRKAEKERLRNEQFEFKDMQMKIKEEYEIYLAMEEKRFQEEAKYVRKHEVLSTEKRKRRMASVEAVQRHIGEQLMELENLKRKKEEIYLKFLCIEREEMERKQMEAQEEQLRRQRISLKQDFSEIIKDKIHEAQRKREEELMYAENVRARLEAASIKERIEGENKREINMTILKENQKLSQYKHALHNAELMEEKAALIAEEKARAERERVVTEERIRLLKSLDTDLLQCLPRGSLTEEDIIVLNTVTPGTPEK